jgi:8-oxo-dGTP pyrophosphatase MutT (NUDIX family)
MPGDPDEVAARIAAVRETLEEAGVAVAVSPLPDRATLGQLRHALAAGATFGDALADAGCTLDLSALTPFARWLPAHRTSRIFDTRFFLARLPAGSAPAQVDATENVALLWSTAAGVLADADDGRVIVIYPTRRNLERLAQFGSIDEALADARAHPVVTITPTVEDRDGTPFLVIPAGLGYPITGEPLADATRG